MQLEDYVRLVAAIRNTAEALRSEADYIGDFHQAEFLRERASACERRASEIEVGLLAGQPAH